MQVQGRAGGTQQASVKGGIGVANKRIAERIG
jgi:hypothetical protein